ncbi:metal ABC transporter substrate-binding protein [Acetoanaerobium sticklandii]|uniref:metal ABC transporter substrate-binding protein n=1 Tax=Acetoanaerobium sticklandii TaxID=1511 RepID=UPI003A8ED171
MTKKTGLISLLLIMMVVLSACNSSVSSSDTNSTNDDEDSKLTVYASFYPIYDFTNKIADDYINLKLIVPAGAEPHHYEISAKTMAELENADLILLNGLEFEPWADSLPESLSSKIISLGEEVNPLPYVEHSHGEHEGEAENSHSEYDPHIWLDPLRASQMSEIIYENLSKLDSTNKAVYETNLKNLKDEFITLDSEYKQLEAIQNKKEIVVSHNAFSYLGERYGLEFHSLSGISPENEPSLKVLSEITDLVNKEGIRVLFFEELANDKIINTIADETGVESDVLYTIEGMTDDEVSAGEDYFSKMRLNLSKLKLAVE